MTFLCFGSPILLKSVSCWMKQECYLNGSVSWTSRAAPRILPSFRAWARAFSSTRPPLAVFTRKAPWRICSTHSHTCCPVLSARLSSHCRLWRGRKCLKAKILWGEEDGWMLLHHTQCRASSIYVSELHFAKHPPRQDLWPWNARADDINRLGMIAAPRPSVFVQGWPSVPAWW